MFNNDYYVCRDLASTEEELSVAALHSVVACVGGTLQQPTHKSDAMGVDVDCKFYGKFTDEHTEKLGKELHIQLKATRKPDEIRKGAQTYWAVQIDVDKLERYLSWEGMVLVLFVVPSDDKRESWVEVDPQKIETRHCLYWTFLRGYPIDKTKKTNTIHIPTTNVLTPGALVNIVALETSRKGRYNV